MKFLSITLMKFQEHSNKSALFITFISCDFDSAKIVLYKLFSTWLLNLHV